MRSVDAWFLPAEGQPEHAQTHVVEEAMISIDVANVGWYTLMWTPTDSAREVLGFTADAGMMAATEDPEVLALAAGFMFTEGLIGGIADIAKMEICASDPSIVNVELVDPGAVEVRRKDVVMGSSCGVCGERESVENLVGDLRPVAQSIQLNHEQFDQLMEAMRELQRVFGMTGGAHAAAVFDRNARILAVAEDLGRHNALDKVIGKCLLTKTPLDGCGVLLSSRMSLEMITKAARAGFELVAAVSAPTSLAIDIGERLGITLCGFVRSGRATIYCHPERVAEIPISG
ncbi:MAG: formate dehydrogenase accessory sulfurtransferase FdhD [Chromatiales bacterium]|nr:MAG: formate dehydrogenase accessory sulfurtransferase FdhD [Chromatiales bacterium]